MPDYDEPPTKAARRAKKRYARQLKALKAGKINFVMFPFTGHGEGKEIKL